MDSLIFTLPEALALLGVAQCVYIVAYMGLRAGRLSRAGLPMAYFAVLALAFALDFGQQHVQSLWRYYQDLQWVAWFVGPPLSVLLIIQIARIHEVPRWSRYWVLALIPLAYGAARLMDDGKDLEQFLAIGGLIAGGISLLTIWLTRDIFTPVQAEKGGKARYWLILSLIFMNLFFLSLALVDLSLDISPTTILLARTVMGLGFVYLVGTSLFRIYPQAVNLTKPRETLSPEEQRIAQKIESLFTLEKVYQEPTYSRARLAQECATSEATLSRIINIHFGKTLPQMLNEYRVEDAKRLLRETDAPVKTVASEVGFNALPSFNRVFKDMTGVTPSEFRKARAA